MFEYFNFSDHELARRAEHERVRRERLELLRSQREAHRPRATGGGFSRWFAARRRHETVCPAAMVRKA
ncbi:hypothetical protein [Psychromicrobium lacuslunae]|uniref:Uncharacterized protein n=1 Tax=Psychromicrobium lacuslunae TaxID=1618207 RepID=A0A0D4BW57_9MICC|nr:hypothetical protein [Psychromicrobium lacuslunae]AJT40361.1 hypothetical protein UM93_00135 [Psychromicrobium lacuslunae]